MSVLVRIKTREKRTASRRDTGSSAQGIKLGAAMENMCVPLVLQNPQTLKRAPDFPSPKNKDLLSVEIRFLCRVTRKAFQGPRHGR